MGLSQLGRQLSLEDGDYYVVFCDSPLKWLKWLKKDYRHCFLVRNEFGKVWTLIQHSTKGLEFSTYLQSDYPSPLDFAGEGASMIKVSRSISEGKLGYFCHMNCVEIVKAAIGVRKTFIFTPYQLYRWLYGRRTGTRREEKAEGCSESPSRSFEKAEAGTAKRACRS